MTFTFEDIILSFIWFGIGFFIGCNAKYSILVGDWKAHHGTIDNPSDEELYTWHKTRNNLNENRKCD